MNLVGNAVKFTERGEVVVKVREAPETREAGLVKREASETREVSFVKRISSPDSDASRFTNDERRGAHRVPIVAMTANAMDEDRRRCLAAGMDDFIAKPVKHEEPAAILKRWLPDKQADNTT